MIVSRNFKQRQISWLYIIIAGLFVALTSLGQLNYALRTPEGYQYTGANPYAAADKLVYKNMIQQGREGIIMMRNVHTTDPQRGSMFSPLWYLIGQTGEIFSLSNTAAYQLYRVLFAFMFCWVLYVMLGKLFEREWDRIVASLVVFFSGGLGWVYLVKNPWLFQAPGQLKFLHSPIDLYVTEGNTLLNFAQAPLFGFAQVSLLFSIYLFVKNHAWRQWPWDLFNALNIVVLGCMHPYDMPILFAIFGSYAVWDLYMHTSWASLLRLARLSFAGLIVAAYSIYTIVSEPVLQEWYRQNLVYSPPWGNYLWAYGFLGLFALVGVVAVLRQGFRQKWWVIVSLWFLAIPILVYIPLDVSRRFINGWHIPLALLAYLGCSTVYRAVGHRWLRRVFVLLVALLFGSSLGLYFFINLFFAPSAYTYGYYYLTPNEQETIQYVREFTTTADRLLTSDMKTSFTLTSELNRLVYRGHDHQTPFLHLRQQQLDWFFAEPDGSEALLLRKQFLDQAGITHIIVSSLRLERDVMWLQKADFVQQVFTSDPFIIYRVVR